MPPTYRCSLKIRTANATNIAGYIGVGFLARSQRVCPTNISEAGNIQIAESISALGAHRPGSAKLLRFLKHDSRKDWVRDSQTLFSGTVGLTLSFRFYQNLFPEQLAGCLCCQALACLQTVILGHLAFSCCVQPGHAC